MVTRLKTASAMPSTLTSGCSPPTSARTDSTATYGREDEELDGDELLGAVLGGLGQHARAGEAPDDDHAGEPLDRRVQAEADQRDRAGHDAGDERDDALDAHHAQRQPGQQPHATRRARGSAPARSSRLAPPRRASPAAARRALMRSRAAAVTAASSARPRSVSVVHHHLALARRDGQAGGTQCADVVGDELLVACDDPRQIAHARLSGLGQRESDGEPGRVGQRLRAGGPAVQDSRAPGSLRRTASAFGRSRQSRSQVSGSVATPASLAHSHERTYVGM